MLGARLRGEVNLADRRLSGWLLKRWVAAWALRENVNVCYFLRVKLPQSTA
jgi:hypothetical protein